MLTVWATPASAQADANTAPPTRVFAPGVETVVPPAIDPKETVGLHDVVELRADESLNWSPTFLPPTGTVYAMAGDARFSRDVWALQFAFKPLRMIRLVDPSSPTGQRLIWYLVYRVTNTGKALKPTFSESDGRFEAVPTESGPVRYVPHFVLQGHDVAPDGGKVYRAYLDRAYKEAVDAIRDRELGGGRLYDSTTMPLEPLAPGEERWGVAMWEGVDPEIDFFSVYARGLTNAYDWTDPPGAYEEGAPPGAGREFVRKTLQLNFWRPGDRFLQHEGEIRYGVPPGKADLYGVGEGVDYAWVYR